jgi:porin
MSLLLSAALVRRARRIAAPVLRSRYVSEPGIHSCCIIAALAFFVAAPPARAEEEVPTAIAIDVAYTSEVISNVAGGMRRGTRYLDNLDLQLAIDLDRSVGWQGARLFFYGLYNNGTSFSNLVGDAQIVSNIETGVQALRLFEAWIEQDLGSASSLKVGLYDLNSEIDAMEASALFFNSAHGIGTDFSQSGENGPSIFPSTSLAARLHMSPAEGWAIRVAVLDGVPNDPNRPARTVIRLNSDDGALLVGEAEAPLAGGRLLLGHWRYTGQAERLDGAGGRRNCGSYLRGEFPLWRRAGAEAGLDGFFRLGIADSRLNAFARFVSAGFTWTGALPSRPDDQWGVALASARTSRAFRSQTGAQRHETKLELTYRAQLTDWFGIQPDLQYVIHPGTDPNLKNALVLGLRTEIAFGVSR